MSSVRATHCLPLPGQWTAPSVASTTGKLWGMKYRPLIGGRRGCQVGPLPSILSIGIGNLLWCGSNQHLPEKQVRENVVSSSIHQGLGQSSSRQRMFRNLQTIFSILCHILVDFLRTATDLPSLPIIIIALKRGMRRKASPPSNIMEKMYPLYAPSPAVDALCTMFSTLAATC